MLAVAGCGMKAGAVVAGLMLMLAVSAPAQHGGGGHSGGFGGGHFGGLFGGHHGQGRSGHGGSARGRPPAAALNQVVGPPRLASFVGFGGMPGFRLFFVTDSFFCPLVPHLVSPFCRFCGGFGGGFFGFPGFGFFDGFEDVYSQPAIVIPPSAGSLQAARPVLVFTNGWTFEVTDYWIDDEGQLRYVTTYGGTNIVALQSLDLYATVKQNAQRGITFTLKLRPEQ
jgi:hypothetical protein